MKWLTQNGYTFTCSHGDILQTKTDFLSFFLYTFTVWHLYQGMMQQEGLLKDNTGNLDI